MMVQRFPRRAVVLAGLLLVVGLLGSVAWAEDAIPAMPSKDFSVAQPYEVVRIVDGDTVVLLVNGKQTTFRLIGVDTPETVHPQEPVEEYGKEASHFLENLLKGEAIYLEYEPGISTLDKYGRTLAYLYRVPDGLFVNLEIVRQGYGHAYTRFPFQYMDMFRFFEQRARESGKGLWNPILESSSEPQGSSGDISPHGGTAQPQGDELMVYMTRTGSKYHREGCRYLSKSRFPMSLKEAKERGLGPCSVCRPPE